MSERGLRIPKADCKDRKLYRIKSRNLAIGVFRAATGGFLGLRTKFGSTFVDEEFHWDNGEPYGTVDPQEELPEELPSGVPNEEDSSALRAWLQEMEARYPRGATRGPRP